MKTLIITLVLFGMSSCAFRDKSTLPEESTPVKTAFVLTCIDAFDNSKMANCKAYISDSLIGTSDASGIINFTLNKSQYDSKVRISAGKGLHDDASYYAKYYNSTKSFYMYPNQKYEKLIWAKEDATYGIFNKEDLPMLSKDSLSGYKNYSKAQFTGGNEALIKYVSNATEYPEKAIENGSTGRANVSFLVQNDGSISHLWVQNQIDDDLKKEAIRVIRNMPKWKPATVNNESLRVRCIMPIVFNLN